MDYRITGARLEGFAEQARRLGNVTGELTPGQIEDTLKKVEIGGGGTDTLEFPANVVYYNNMNGYRYARVQAVFSEYDAASGNTTKLDGPVTNALWCDAMVAVMRDGNIYRDISFQETLNNDSPKFLDNGFGAANHPGFTVGAWFCKTESTGDYARLLHVYANPAANFGLHLRNTSAYSIYRDIPGIGYLSTAELKHNQWFHLAYSIERIPDSGLIAKTYYNGCLIATDHIADDNYSFSRIRIGSAGSYPWPGYVKNAFISDGVLTDEEVRLMMLYEQVSDKSTRLPSADMALTLQIKAYDSLEQLSLDAPEQGNIGLVTEAVVSEHIFSASEPLLPDEGTVWVQTGLDSNVSFFASRDDYLQVCPVLAKQYAAGAWRTIPAKTYLNGEWVTWRVPLYTFGDEHKACTGGWIAEAKSFEGTTASIGTVTRYPDSIKLSRTNHSGFIFRCANPIDLTGHTTLRFEGNLTAQEDIANWMQLVLWSELGTYSNDNVVSAILSPIDGAAELDVSALDGPHYVGLLQYGKGSSATLRKLYIQ